MSRNTKTPSLLIDVGECRRARGGVNYLRCRDLQAKLCMRESARSISSARIGADQWIAGRVRCECSRTRARSLMIYRYSDRFRLCTF